MVAAMAAIDDDTADDDTVDDDGRGDIDRARRVAAARGRFARNALIQGAAAEFFKIWAIIVRARGASLGAEVVLIDRDAAHVRAIATDGLAVEHAGQQHWHRLHAVTATVIWLYLSDDFYAGAMIELGLSLFVFAGSAQ